MKPITFTLIVAVLLTSAPLFAEAEPVDPQTEAALRAKLADATPVQRATGMALYYLQTAQPARAVQPLRQVLAEPANQSNAELWYLLSNAYNRLQQYDQAEQAINVALNLQPAEPRYYLQAALPALGRQQYDQAATYLTIYLHAPEARPVGYHLLAFAMAQKGEPAKVGKVIDLMNERYGGEASDLETRAAQLEQFIRQADQAQQVVREAVQESDADAARAHLPRPGAVARAEAKAETKLASTDE
jgi:tetratricopeptide (TPR) repeat protein